METVTVSELHRNLQDHIRYENDYQIRFEEKLDAILLQTTKTNGNVIALQHWKETEAHPIVIDYRDKNSQAKGAVKLWTLVWGSVVAGVGLAGTMYVNVLKNDVINTTITRLQNSTFKIEELKKGTDIYSIKIYEQK